MRKVKLKDGYIGRLVDKNKGERKRVGVIFPVDKGKPEVLYKNRYGVPLHQDDPRFWEEWKRLMGADLRRVYLSTMRGSEWNMMGMGHVPAYDWPC